MASQFLKDFASSVMLGTTPGVKRPSVNRPNPFDNDGRMDISDRFRPVQDYSNSSSSAYQQSYSQGSTERTDSYGGPLDVSGMTQSVANQFVGMDPTLGSTLSMTGINPFMALGAGLSKKNLENIESKIAEGTSGYALGMVNGRIVGVSPSLFGGYDLSGVLPTGLNTEQRNQLINNLLASREMIDNPKDFAVSPQPSIQPSDEERAISYKQNVVTDSSDNPVTSGESYVTTRQGQYVNQQELEAQLEATRREADRQAAEEARQAEEAAQQARVNAAREEAGRTRQESERENRESDSRGSGHGTDRDPGYSGGYRAAGGTVGFAEGGTAQKDPIQSTGFVDGPPQAYAKGTTVADTENHRVRVGSFVINAPTTERLQKEGKLPKGPQKMKAAKGGKMMEVALSKGEYVVDVNDIDKFGGYDALNAENDKGKPEVDRRQAMQEGGKTGINMPPLSRGFVQRPASRSVPEGFVQQQNADVGPIPPLTINDINISNVQKVLTRVETRGYEDRNEGYFFTRSGTKTKPSSAFGPLQITHNTMLAMLEKPDKKKKLKGGSAQLSMEMKQDPEFKQYIIDLEQDLRNRANVKQHGLVYEGGGFFDSKGKVIKRNPTAEEKQMYKNLGTGSISVERHKEHHPTFTNLYMRYKAEMSDSEEDLVRRHFGNDASTKKYFATKKELGIN